MGFSKLTAVASAALLLSGSAYAQTRQTSKQMPKQPQVPAEPRVAPTPDAHPLPMKTSAAAPLTLRNGAKATGLSGFYDYQSNGMSPGHIWVDRNNPNNIYTTYMLSLVAGDSVVISVNRRVGFAKSTNAGATWAATKDVTGNRLGFPFLGATKEFALIATHGNPLNEGVQTILLASDTSDIQFTNIQTYPRTSVFGRDGDDGAGVIWPAVVGDPKNPGKVAMIASLSPLSGETQAPLHYVASDISNASPEWKQFDDSLMTKTSGGNYTIAASAGGKIGIAYHNVDESFDVRGLYFTESSDGGNTWSTPVRIFGPVETEEFIDISGTVDTLEGGSNMDLTYAGETPNVVFAANTGLFVSQSIQYWNPNSGVQRLLKMDSALGIGITTAFLNENNMQSKTQPNMDYIDYPTIATSADGRRILVAFQAAAQFNSADGYVMSEEGFAYNRVWAMGSDNGGGHWSQPYLLQDFAGAGSDSASIEYPSLDEVLRPASGGYKYSMTFQGRRHPGMYAFTVANVSPNAGETIPADAGPVEEVFQYFQSQTLDDNKFRPEGAAVSQSQEFSSKAGLKFLPNPAASNVRIEYTLPTSGSVDVRVFNTLGVEVSTPVAGQSAFAGTYFHTVDVSALPAGSYRVVLSQNGNSISKALNVIH